MIGLLVQHPWWRFLASVRLLIGLLILFVILAVVGAAVKEGSKVFGSWYFALLLILLSINVIFCTTRRLVLKAIKGIRLFGYLTLHISLIVIFVGGAISALGTERGSLQVWEGGASNKYFNERRNLLKELPFTLVLDRFTVERYEEYPPPVVHAAIPEEMLLTEFPADLKKSFKVGRASYWVTPLRYLPDFSLDLASGRAFTRSDQPRNPALLVEIQGEQGIERRWLFARYPELEIAQDPRLKLVFHWRPLKVKQFVSHVQIFQEDRPVCQATIAVNRPLRFQGWRIYQVSYDPQEHRWSGFFVSRDPGIKIVYPGFLLLIIGVITLLGLGPWIKRKENPIGLAG